MAEVSVNKILIQRRRGQVSDVNLDWGLGIPGDPKNLLFTGFYLCTLGVMAYHFVACKIDLFSLLACPCLRE